jgi:hypothetical protein
VGAFAWYRNVGKNRDAATLAAIAHLRQFSDPPPPNILRLDAAPTCHAIPRQRPALLVEGVGLGTIQHHIRRPPTRRVPLRLVDPVDVGTVPALRLIDLMRRPPATAAHGRARVHPTRRDVECPAAPLLHVPRDRPGQGFPGHHDRLERWFQRRAPPRPLPRRRRRRGRHVVDLAEATPVGSAVTAAT